MEHKPWIRPVSTYCVIASFSHPLSQNDVPAPVRKKLRTDFNGRVQNDGYLQLDGNSWQHHSIRFK